MTRTNYQTLETMFHRLQSFEDGFLCLYSLDFYFPYSTAPNELVQAELIYDTIHGQQNDLFSINEATCKYLVEEFELTGYSLIVLKSPALDSMCPSFY
jgi:hypothetical protein